MKKRVISLMLVLALCLGLCVPAMAEGEEGEGTPTEGETEKEVGTEEEPKIVKTAGELGEAIAAISGLIEGEYYVRVEAEDAETDISFPDTLTISTGVTVNFKVVKGKLQSKERSADEDFTFDIVNNGTLNLIIAAPGTALINIDNKGQFNIDTEGTPTGLSDGFGLGTVKNFGSMAVAEHVDNLRISDFYAVGKNSRSTGSFSVFMYLTVSDGADWTITEGHYSPIYSIYIEGNSTVTVSGAANFSADEDLNDTGYGATLEEGCTLIYDTTSTYTNDISGFVGCEGTIEIRQGRFSSDPAAYLAAGSTVTEDNGVYIVTKGTGPDTPVNPNKPACPILDPVESTGPFSGSVTVTMTLPEGAPMIAEIYYSILPYTTAPSIANFDWHTATKYTGPVTLRQSGTVVAQTVVRIVAALSDNTNVGAVLPAEPANVSDVAWRAYIVNPGSSSSSSSDDDDDNTTTSITTNPNGSTTTTVTDTRTGTITETTRDKDGTRTVKETKKDGTVTTTTTRPDGSSSKSVQGPVGKEMEFKYKLVEEPTVTLFSAVSVDTAVTVSGQGDDKRVVIPITGLTAGTVAVVDGKVVPTAVTTSAGLSLPLADGATVQFKENTKTFSDVENNFWGSDAVTFVTSRELFNGTGGGSFSPNATMTRQMLMTVLARLDGADTSGSAYEKGMAWATNAGISDGRDPESSVSREQLAVMLYRYADTLGLEKTAQGDLSKFSDSEKTSSWAQDAMRWAVGEGLIGGKGGGIVDPAGTATRAEVAAILQRMVNLMAK